MRFSFSEPAQVVLGDVAGVLTVAVKDFVFDPDDFTFEWALIPWSGAEAEMTWASVTASTPVETADPVLNIPLFSFTLPLAKSDVPDDLDPDLYFVQIRMTGEDGVTYLVGPRTMAVIVYPAPEFAAP